MYLRPIYYFAVLWLMCAPQTLIGIASAAQIQVLEVSVTPSGAKLRISSDIGMTNQIQYLSGLPGGSWTALTNVMVSESPYSFIDTLSPTDAQRFYRVVGSFPATNTTPDDMVLIPAGSFQMGDGFYEGQPWELPVHTVQVSAFYLAKYEVTLELWNTVRTWAEAHGYTFENTGGGKAPSHPVESLNWYDMVKWCNARSEMGGRVPAYSTDAANTQVYRTGRAEPYVNWHAGYRLPSEAEWERAARGGVAGHRFPWSDEDTITHARANYFSDPSFGYDVSPSRGFNPTFEDGSFPYTSPVGSFAPNGFGVYDMAGNVWEWCWDYAGPYPSDPQTDPHGPDTGSTRVGRGGNWNYYAEHCRVAYRYGNAPDYSATNIGFRCALPGQ